MYLGVVVFSYIILIVLEFFFIDEVIIEDNYLSVIFKSKFIDVFIFLFFNFKNVRFVFSLRKFIFYILVLKIKIYFWFY